MCHTRSSIAFIALTSALLLLAACSEETPPNQTADGGVTAPDGGGMTPDDLGGQEPLDMARDTGGTTPQDMGGGETGGDMTAGDGGADMMDMAADMSPFPADLGMDSCAWPSSDPGCPMTAFGPGAFFNTLKIVRDDTCCRDFDGDGTDDNYIGRNVVGLLETATGQDFDANTTAAINAGALVYLLEFANWSNERWDAMLDVTVLTGADSDTDFAPNLMGTGQFLASGDSYDPVTDDPKWSFQRAEVRDRRLVATGGNIRLDFPGLSDAVDLELVDVQIEADVEPGADLQGGGGATLLNGELSGVLLRDQLFGSLNDVARACPCIGTPILSKNDNGSYSCVLTQAQAQACEPSPSSTCRSIGSMAICQGILPGLSRQVDVDVDGDGKEDGYSFGARFSTVPAEITGRL